MDIHEFGEALGQKIATTKLGARFRDEKTFEKEVLVKTAWQLSRQHPEIRVFTRLWKRKAKGHPNCEAAGRNFIDRVEGCPVCWKRRKKQTWRTCSECETTSMSPRSIKPIAAWWSRSSGYGSRRTRDQTANFSDSLDSVCWRPQLTT